MDLSESHLRVFFRFSDTSSPLRRSSPRPMTSAKVCYLSSSTNKPYQLKPEGVMMWNLFLEPPISELPPLVPPEPKKLKRMKKKLDELNSKIRHVRKKKHDGLIHKWNLLRKAIEKA